MSNVQNTIGVIELLNEKIKLLDEEFNNYLNELKNINIRNMKKKTVSSIKITFGTILLIIGTIGGCLGASMLNHNKADPVSLVLFILGVGSVALGMILLYYSKIKLENTSKIKQLIENAKIILAEKKLEKANYILSKEKILSEQNKIVDLSVLDTLPGTDTKECPRCAETIKLKAKVCRYCGYSFEEKE